MRDRFLGAGVLAVGVGACYFCIRRLCCARNASADGIRRLCCVTGVLVVGVAAYYFWRNASPYRIRRFFFGLIPPPPTFDRPWRTLAWRENPANLQRARNYQPDHDEVTHLRVMVYGPAGAGKSSFINSVSSTLRGMRTFQAEVGPIQGTRSWTKKYEAHRIKRGDRGDYYKFVFNDMMGVEDGSEHGVHVEDIILAMKGHVRDNYKFKPMTPLSSRDDPHYIQEPSPDDKVHVLVCVCPANVSEINDSTLTKMKEIRKAARDLGIPCLLIVTKVDQACPETEENLQNVYRSKYIKRKMEEFGIEVGIPMNYILPVKNYSEESANDPDIDTLILSVLKLILAFGNENLDRF